LVKKILFISLALVIALTVFMPAPALAAKPVPFYASGIITAISDGTVKPAGDSGRFVVVTRDIEVVLNGDIGQPNIHYAFSYKANVELATQAGNLHGTLLVDGKTLNINGKIGVGMTPLGIHGLIIDGHWNFTDGAKGEGDLAVWALPITDKYGHVLYIPYSSFTLTGQWQP